MGGSPAEEAKAQTPVHNNPARTPHIAIVGAGVAGLSCAGTLLVSGLRVTIFEARPRIGGRVHQVTIPNTPYVVDAGANWIHGTEHNPILDMAATAGTVTHSWEDEESNLFDDQGEPLGTEQAEELGKLTWGIIVDAFRYSDANTKMIDPGVSLYHWFEERVVECLPETEDGWEAKRKMVLQMSELWGSFVGAPIHKQSLKYFWLEESVDGGNLFNASTYATILASIARPALAADIIQLSTPIISIASSPANTSITLTTAAGTTHEFDDVVVTCPLGWLQKHHVATFFPPLPPRITTAITSLGYGDLEKIYVAFPRAFWIDHKSTGFTQFLQPGPYAQSQNPRSVNVEVLELASLSGGCGMPVLLFYLVGEGGREWWMERNKGECASAAIDGGAAGGKQEVDFLRPYFTRLPGWTEADEPVGVWASSWRDDVWAGQGSYSYFPARAEEQEDDVQRGRGHYDADVETLRHGCPERRLWFAGEHTAPFVAMGTVTGAYWAGEGVGTRIVGALGM